MTPYTARIAHLLPDDGIVDPVAVAIAVTGERPVALTRTEQRAAARVLISRGVSTTAISYRLRINATTVDRLRQTGTQEVAA